MLVSVLVPQLPVNYNQLGPRLHSGYLLCCSMLKDLHVLEADFVDTMIFIPNLKKEIIKIVQLRQNTY